MHHHRNLTFACLLALLCGCPEESAAPTATTEAGAERAVRDDDASASSPDPSADTDAPSDADGEEQDAASVSATTPDAHDAGTSSALDAATDSAPAHDAESQADAADAQSDTSPGDAENQACSSATAPVCASTAVLRTCENGVIREQTCPPDQTCLQDSAGARCGGVCRAVEQRCAGAGQPQICTSVGAWQQTGSCDATSQVCKKPGSQASCQSAFVLGNDSFDGSESWTLWSVPLDVAFFIPVVVEKSATLDYFHLRGAAKGGTCRFALYDDASGAPGHRLATGFSPLAVDVGVQHIESDWRAPLSAGSTYWIGARCVAAVGAQLYQRSVAGTRSFRFAQAAGPFPDNPSGELQTGTTYSFFITTQPVP